MCMLQVQEHRNNESDLEILHSIVGDEKVFHEIVSMFCGSSVYFPKLKYTDRADHIRGVYRNLLAIEGMTASRCGQDHCHNVKA